MSEIIAKDVSPSIASINVSEDLAPEIKKLYIDNKVKGSMNCRVKEISEYGITFEIKDISIETSKRIFPKQGLNAEE